METKLKLFDKTLKLQSNPYYEKLYHQQFQILRKAFIPSLTTDRLDYTVEDICQFLCLKIGKRLNQLDKAEKSFQLFSKEVNNADNKQSKQAAIYKFICSINDEKKARKNFKKALNYWFDEAAATENYRAYTHNINLSLRYNINRLGSILSQLIQSQKISDLDTTWNKFNLNTIIRAIFEVDDHSVIAESIWLLNKIVIASKDRKFFTSHTDLKTRILNLIPKLDHIGLLRATVTFLSQIDQLLMLKISLDILNDDTKEKIDIFCQRAVAEILILYTKDRASIIDPIVNHPSNHVKQSLALFLDRFTNEQISNLLGLFKNEAGDSAVICQIISSFKNIFNRKQLREALLDFLIHNINSRNDDVVKFSFDIIQDLFLNNRSFFIQQKQFINDVIARGIEIRGNAEHLELRRKCARYVEVLYLLRKDENFTLYTNIKSFINEMKQLKKYRLPNQLSKPISLPDFYRVFCIATNLDWPIDWIEKSNHIILIRGVDFRRKFWRFWFEFWHRSSEKRSNVNHTSGRYYRGNRHFPSELLYDVIETHVPGEPVIFPRENSWRPYLPLLDQATAKFFQGSTNSYYIHTAEGITEIQYPKSLLKRIMAKIHINFQFSNISKLRLNDNPDGPNHAYKQYLQDLGIIINFSFHQYDEFNKINDNSVSQLFVRDS